ncbi:MAG TPA: M13 family metallopeptidase [Vicinamibacterales bacterium]|nr:M13 family metallopeptidase [Vicinamibacterales bacterium]
MTASLRLALAAALSLATACRGEQPQRSGTAAPSTAASGTHDIDRAGIDPAVAPGDDFFRYANGGWLKKNEIPPDRSSYGIGGILSDRAQERTHELLEAAAGGSAAAGSDERKIGDYYASYMDEAAIEAKGLAPLRDELADIAAIGDARGLAAYVGGSLRADVDALNSTNYYTDRLFGVWITQNLNDPAHAVPYLLQGGLGMPDRDYYVEPGARMDSNRSAYRGHIAAMLKLAQVADADTKAGRIFDLERRIADVHATRTDSVEVSKANNPWPRDEFSRRAPGLDWAALFHAARLDPAPTIIVWHPDAIRGIAALVPRVPLETWRDYLTFHAIDRRGGMLPKAFGDERFAFYGKVLSGTPRRQDLWKRAVDATDAALGEAVGKIYVQKYFPAASKTQLQEMVSKMSVAFDRRLDALSWMAPKTKTAAKAKLKTLRVGVGYPDRWRDFSRLSIVRGDALGNLERAELFDYEYHLAKLTQAPDQSEWWMTPQTVNAVNLPLQNALNFPAAILEPPYYDPAASAAIRYGAVGAIIGHEISHSFDDQGSQFDAEGRFTNWWTPDDLAHFKDASAKLVAQYNAYTPFPDAHVNGQLTLSENIADVAGLSAAYDAYRADRGQTAGAAEEDDRSFFLSFAQSWRAKFREPLARQLVLTDGHAPDEYRADTVRNLDPWYGAFDVKPGQKLFLAPPDRVRVW